MISHHYLIGLKRPGKELEKSFVGSISTALATLDFVPPREARAHFPEQRLVIQPTMEDKRTWDFLKARFRFARLATLALTLSTCSKSTCVKKPFQVIVTYGYALNDNFLIGFGFILSFPPPPPPRQCFGQKSTLCYPFCSKFNFV